MSKDFKEVLEVRTEVRFYYKLKIESRNICVIVEHNIGKLRYLSLLEDFSFDMAQVNKSLKIWSNEMKARLVLSESIVR